MNNTLANGFKILEFLAGSAETYSVKELAELFELPNSHICRLLKTLLETGYVEQDKSRKYRVSLNVLCLSNACLSKLTVRNKVRPYLHKLMITLNTDTYLAVPQNGRALIVDSLFPNGKGSDIGMTIGRINGVHATSCGKLCAAYSSPETQKSLIKADDLIRYTNKTLISEDELLAEFTTICHQGYSIADSELNEKTFAVAAPVFGYDGELQAALGTFQYDVSEQRKKEMLSLTIDLAQSASFAMGYTLGS